MARLGVARRGKARQGYHASVPHRRTRLGEARRGGARHGEAWQGLMFMAGKDQHDRRVRYMKKMNVKIEGITSLLVNRFLEKQIADKIKRRTSEAKKIPTEEKLYTIKGKPYIPCRYIEACMIEAGKQFKIQGKGKATYSKILGAMVSVEPEALVLKPDKWEEFNIPAVNPNTRGRMMVNRPKFDSWGLEFTIVCEDDDIPTDTLERILAYAGHFVGIGDWRPEKKGKFGKFRIVEFKEVKGN